MPRAGDPAPGFSLEGTDGTDSGRRTYSLEEFRGDPVVLVFYPADNSPVCTVQLRSYTVDIGAFAETGAQVLAISPQSVEAHDTFAADNGGARVSPCWPMSTGGGPRVRHPRPDRLLPALGAS